MTGPSEVAPAYVVPGTMTAHTDLGPGPDGGVPVSAQVVSTPTQVRHPWRSTVRTLFQMGLALATLVPFVLGSVYDDTGAAPAAVAQVLAVAGIVTKVMALPQVERFLQDFAPWLATSPPALTRSQRKALSR